MTEDRPDCPTCGVMMDLGNFVQEPDDGGPATYFYVCRNTDCPETKHWVNDLPDDDEHEQDTSDADADGESTLEAPDDDPVSTMIDNADLSDHGADT